MKRKCTAYLAWLLTAAVLMFSVPLDAIAASAATATDTHSEITELGLSVGQGLIDTYVSGGDAFPDCASEGWTQDDNVWSYGMPKDGWGWWRGNASATYSASFAGENTLTVSAYQTDNVILLPKLPSTNYKFEATFTVEGETDPNGSFGLITNIAPAYTESIGGTMFVAYAAGHSSGAKNRVYTRNKAKKANIGEELYEGSNTTYVPAGYTAPGAGDSVTMTAYVYEGKNYYYINGIYVGAIDAKLTTEGESLCGFFCSGNAETTVTITDISVKELVISQDDTTGEDDDTTSGGDNTTGGGDDETGAEEEAPKGLDFDGSYTLGEILLETDFEDTEVGQLPEGWQKGSKASGASFGYTDNQSAATMVGEVTALEGYGNVLHFNSYLTDAYITTPATGTMDYVFEATVIVNYDTEGEFGLANNFYAGVNEADGCLYNSSHIVAAGAEKKESTWKYRKSNGSTKGTWAVSYYPKKGDTANLKIVSYKGYNYIYWNEILCGIAEQRGVTGGGTATSDNPGFFTYGGDLYITEAKITKIYYDKAELTVDGATLTVTEDSKVGIDAALTFDKTQEIYSKYVTGDYAYSDTADLKFGVVMAVGSSQIAQEIDVNTAGVTDTIFTDCIQDESKIGLTYSITDIPEENYDKFYTLRPYCLVQGAYYYGEAKAYSAAELANGIYGLTDDDDLKDILADIFADSKVFVGKEAASLTFTLFSDFHYKEGMYSTTIADLKSILQRADTSDSAFIMSAGDFCNDALGSPELFNAYLNYYTSEGNLLPAYNIYGNHELESANNSMEVVTPLLTNSNVVWGTADGSYDASVAYYYFESNGFRIVCTDNNYSWNPTGEYWEHNRTKSYGAPSGNTNTYSLGPDQLTWLEAVLTDAANQDIPCIIVEHSVSSEVRTIYQKVNDINPGTVLMCISGHTHTNEQDMEDGVFHLVVNTTRNGEWVDGGTAHYTDEHTFLYEEYDTEGNLVGTYEKSLGSLKQGKNTWFFEDPLSAVITINEYGVITVDGCESKWAYDIVPESASGSTEPRISSGTYWACDLLGHSLVYSYDDAGHWSAECANTLCNAVVEKTAHTYGEWSVVKEATAAETGLKERICTVCGKKQTEDIPVTSGESDNTGSGSEESGENDSTGTGGEGTGENESTGTSGEGTGGNESAESGSDSSDEDSAAATESKDAEENSTNQQAAAQLTGSNVPPTGDQSHLLLWIMLILLSGTVLCRIGIVSRKKRKS